MSAPWHFSLDGVVAAPVSDYGAIGVGAVALANGPLAWAATVLVCEPGGGIDAHVAGRDQIFMPLEGRGWLEIDGVREELSSGSYGVIRAGQLHAKGAITRLVALVLQSPTIDLVAPELGREDGVAPSATPSSSLDPGTPSPG